jgi:hypothetical protein
VQKKIFGKIGRREKHLGEEGAEENVWENRVQRKIFGRIGCRGKYLGK